MARYSREAIADALRRVYAQHGRALSKREWRRNGLVPTVPQIVYQFGSWSRAWLEACGVHTKPMGRPGYSRQDLLRVMREAAGPSGRPLRIREWNERVRAPSAKTIIRCFGSWQRAWSDVGLPSPVPGAAATARSPVG